MQILAAGPPLHSSLSDCPSISARPPLRRHDNPGPRRPPSPSIFNHKLKSLFSAPLIQKAPKGRGRGPGTWTAGTQDPPLARHNGDDATQDESSNNLSQCRSASARHRSVSFPLFLRCPCWQHATAVKSFLFFPRLGVFVLVALHRRAALASHPPIHPSVSQAGRGVARRRHRRPASRDFYFSPNIYHPPRN